MDKWKNKKKISLFKNREWVTLFILKQLFV